jgi:hypothetical protein
MTFRAEGSFPFSAGGRLRALPQCVWVVTSNWSWPGFRCETRTKSLLLRPPGRPARSAPQPDASASGSGPAVRAASVREDGWRRSRPKPSAGAGGKGACGHSSCGRLGMGRRSVPDATATCPRRCERKGHSRYAEGSIQAPLSYPHTLRKSPIATGFVADMRNPTGGALAVSLAAARFTARFTP